MRLVLNGWMLNVQKGDEIEVKFDGPFIEIRQYRLVPDGSLLPHKTYTLTPQERARTAERQAMAAMKAAGGGG